MSYKVAAQTAKRRNSISGDDFNNETSFGEDSKSLNLVASGNGLYKDKKQAQNLTSNDQKSQTSMCQDSKKKKAGMKGQFMSFIDSQQFSPIQSV